MKKLVLILAVMFAFAMVSCTGMGTKNVASNDSDSISVDTVQVDTVSADSIVK